MQSNDIKSISRRRSVSFYAKSHCVIGFNPFNNQCPDTNQGHTLIDQLVLIPTRNYLVAVTKMSSVSLSPIWEARTFDIECLSQIDHISTLSQHGCTLALESIHGREKGRTPFISTGVGKVLNKNCRCEFLLMNDPRSSAPQSPAGTGVRLGSGIGNQVSRLNCTPV